MNIVIVGKIEVDRVGRFMLTKIFDEMPERVVPSFDTGTKKLFFKEAAEDEDPRVARKVDSKKRVCLPRWVTDELGEEFFVFAESAKEHAVLPSKFVFMG